MFDHLEVLRARTPRYDGRHLQFEPDMRWEPRGLHDLRRLLWIEMDRQGNEVPLSAMQAFFGAEKHLTGIRFVYNADIQRAVGVCSGERAAVSLGADEVPVAMDLDIRRTPGAPGNIIVACITILGRRREGAALVAVLCSRLMPCSCTSYLNHRG